MSRFSRILILGGLSLLTACASLPERNPVPENLLRDAQVPGFDAGSGLRFWADTPPANMQALRRARFAQLQARNDLPAHRHLLALSGGADGGAFGAGVLTGWTQRGDRPEFEIITGVSIGAITAPLAFLGPEYDGVMRTIMTEDDWATTLKPSVLQAIRPNWLGGRPAFVDAENIEAVLARHFTPTLLREVAAEHARGRRLWVGTVNLDAGRPMVWDLGVIATRFANARSDDARDTAIGLFHDVLRASAAIPMAMPPVSIEVTARDQTYNELHVDGGAATQAFIYPSDISVADAPQYDPREGTLHIIRNATLSQPYAAVDGGILNIGLRGTMVLMSAAGIGDLYRMYARTQRDGIDYRLTYIESEPGGVAADWFGAAYMDALFAQGRALGAHGPAAWNVAPPGYRTVAGAFAEDTSNE